MDGMTGVAVVVGFALVMASHARLHADRFLLSQHILVFDFAMAGGAGNPGFPDVPFVRERDEVRKAIEPGPWRRFLSLGESGQLEDRGAVSLHRDVAVHAQRLSGHA